MSQKILFQLKGAAVKNTDTKKSVPDSKSKVANNSQAHNSKSNKPKSNDVKILDNQEPTMIDQNTNSNLTDVSDTTVLENEVGADIVETVTTTDHIDSNIDTSHNAPVSED